MSSTISSDRPAHLLYGLDPSVVDDPPEYGVHFREKGKAKAVVII